MRNLEDKLTRDDRLLVLDGGHTNIIAAKTVRVAHGENWFGGLNLGAIGQEKQDLVHKKLNPLAPIPAHGRIARPRRRQLTIGNTGIAYAMRCTALGFRVLLTKCGIFWSGTFDT